MAKETLRQQTDAARALREKGMNTVDKLQTALANGQISEDDYYNAVGGLFDQQLKQLQGDLREQGRGKEAQDVPVGIGRADTPRQTARVLRDESSPFDPPQGVQFDDGRQQPALPKLNEDDELLFGPSDRPEQSVTTPHSVGTASIPQEVYTGLPALLEAAQDPDAPPAIRALVRMLDYHING